MQSLLDGGWMARTAELRSLDGRWLRSLASLGYISLALHYRHVDRLCWSIQSKREVINQHFAQSAPVYRRSTAVFIAFSAKLHHLVGTFNPIKQISTALLSLSLCGSTWRKIVSKMVGMACALCATREASSSSSSFTSFVIVDIELCICQHRRRSIYRPVYTYITGIYTCTINVNWQ